MEESSQTSFKIANQEITVIIEDSLPNNDYGYFL